MTNWKISNHHAHKGYGKNKAKCITCHIGWIFHALHFNWVDDNREFHIAIHCQLVIQ